MKILHVTIVNPERHQGGLNRYCLELMNQEKRLGNEIVLLYPGQIKSNGHLSIKKHNNNFYSIKGALPVAITYGIDNPQRYMKAVNKDVYSEWLIKIKPDVIHVHSVQGIHKEFFKAAKELNIRMIYTTHDYCMICPKCILVDNCNEICEGFNADKCAECNYSGGLSERKQKILQSTLYPIIKDNTLVKLIKRKLSNGCENQQSNTVGEMQIDKRIIDDFEKLRKYYSDIFEMFDSIHCNSNLAMEAYLKVFPNKNYKVIPITHEGLMRSKHEKNSSLFRITYMGGETYHKGYIFLEKAISLLQKRNLDNWNISYYGSEFHNDDTGNKYYRGYFSSAQEQKVWENTDVLVVPSQWKETFGFIVLEALCREIPVICSDVVGSKDLVQKIDEKLVFNHNNPEELCNALIYIMDDSRYKETVRKIEGMELEYDMEKHAKDILELY